MFLSFNWSIFDTAKGGSISFSKFFQLFFRVFSAIHPLRVEFGKQDDSRIFSPSTVIFIPFAPVRRIIYRRVFLQILWKRRYNAKPFYNFSLFCRLPEKKAKKEAPSKESTSFFALQGFFVSVRRDLNPRPQRPERCALPSWATHRQMYNIAIFLYFYEKVKRKFWLFV